MFSFYFYYYFIIMDKEQLKTITDCITEYANALSAENIELIKMWHQDKCYCISENIKQLTENLMRDKWETIGNVIQTAMILFTICFAIYILYLWTRM